MSYKKRLFVVLCFQVFCYFSCTEPTYKEYTHNPRLFRETVKKLNDIILRNNFPPVTASRNYTYATIAAYEVIAAGDPKHFHSLYKQIKELGRAPSPLQGVKLDYDLASVLAFCTVGSAVTFPEGSMDEFVSEILHQVKVRKMPPDVIQSSVAYATSVAKFILAWSKRDHYAQTRSESRYEITQEKGRWTPTPPMYAQATEPHWYEIRTLVLDSSNQIRVPSPPRYDMTNKQSQFYRNTLEVKNIVDHLSPEQKHIADFWDDNPFKLNVIGHVMFATKKFSPVGHWMNIVGIATETCHLDFSHTVSTYTYASIGIFDSFVSCWYVKFHTNYIRPETVINRFIDEEWKPYLQTPPFPEYTSGHAVISAAAAEILSKKLGEHIAFRDTSETEFGIAPLRFSSFREAAAQAATSRVYGGIHFTNSCRVGAEQGKAIGLLVWNHLKLDD